MKKKQSMQDRMVPLLSFRSILLLGLGLLLGGVLGFVYWALSPLISSSFSGIGSGGFSNFAIGNSHLGLYESIANVQVVNPGSSYIPLKNLQQTGEYYAAKANAFPFMEFLRDELNREAPQYAYTVEQLVQITRIRYDYKGDLPAIEIKVTGKSDQEAFFLADFIPKVFQKYLIAEETKAQAKEKELITKEIESVSGALFEAEKSQSALELKAAGSNINDSPAYLVLSAKIAALQVELNNEASKLAALITAGDIGDKYEEVQASLEWVSIALGEAKAELSILQSRTKAERLAQDFNYRAATSRVENLKERLTKLSADLALLQGNDAGLEVDYLAVGKPSIPSLVPPERVKGRNALLMGAIIGVIGGWVLLNFRWILKMLAEEAHTPEEGHGE